MRDAVCGYVSACIWNMCMNLGWYELVVRIWLSGEGSGLLEVLWNTHDLEVPILDWVFLGLTKVL